MSEGTRYWLTAVAGDKKEEAHVRIARLLGQHQLFAFSERSPGPKRVRAGDFICFYAKGKGVVAHGRIASPPTRRPDRRVADEPERYPYTISLSDVRVYVERPINLDAALRSRLETLKDQRSRDQWGWLVRSVQRITIGDFMMLTRTKTMST